MMASNSNRNALGDLNGNTYHAATFPRRKKKAYSWYHPEDTLSDKKIKMENRRTQLLDEYSENEDVGNVSIGEWIALVAERDRLLKESMEKENEEAKLKFISELRQLLSDVPDFSPQKDVDVFKSVTLLKENINNYCSAHKITDTTTNDRQRENQHVLSEIQKSPPLSVKPSPKPVKPPVPPKKPKISPAKTSGNDSGHGSNLRTGVVLRTNTVPMKTETQKDHWDSNNDIKQYKSNNGSSEATVDNSCIPQPSGIAIANVLPSTETIAVNSVPPSCVPPPPPLPIACRLLYQEERRLSCGSLPNSNCSSFSLQDEITTHKKDNLRRVTGPKSPGGTPVKTLEHADMLQRALMKKFRLIRMHSTPKRGGLMESGSMEVSNTWSEWGASLDTHQYASDPDLTHFSSSRNMTSPPLRHSSPCSAADFEFTNYSSPSRS